MSILTNEPTLTIANFKKIRPHHVAYLMLVLTLILPFFIFKRAPPNYAFFAELTSAICASLFIFFASLSIKNFVIYNRVSIYLLIFASYLVFDLIVNSPVYPSLHWLYIGSLLLCFLLATTLDSFAREQGTERVFSIICYGLMIGGVLQDVIILLQMLHKNWLYGWIFYIDEGGAYSGNIGQRNMTAHYLSWGILSTTYLVYTKKVPKTFGWLLIVLQALCLGATNSRTLIVYMLTIVAALLIIYIWQNHLSKVLLKTLTITAILVLLFQAITLPLFKTMLDWSSISDTSIGRISNSEGMTIRFVEWYKAWLIFLEHPWFGTGWGSYSYESFVVSSSSRFIDAPYSSVVFSNTHNLVLNLLAEVGIIGTSLLLGIFLWMLSPLFQIKWQPITVVTSSMIIVTIVHSMLEFPLWYFNFFSIFVIMITFAILSVHSENLEIYYNFSESRFVKYIFISSALAIFLLSVNLYYNYQRLDKIHDRLISDETHQDLIVTAEKLLAVEQDQPLLTAYSDIKAVHYLSALPSHLMPQAFYAPLKRYAYYSPDFIAAMYYLISQCNASGKWESKDWLYFSQLKNYHRNLPAFLSILMSTNYNCRKVYPIIYEQCVEYHTIRNQKILCNYNEVEKR